MKYLFHLTQGRGWTEFSHEENLRRAQKIMSVYGGTAYEVTLIARSNVDEADPPYVTRLVEERAVAVEITLDALAEYVADFDLIAHVMACRRWEDSDHGCLTHRICISDPAPDLPQEGPSF